MMSVPARGALSPRAPPSSSHNISGGCCGTVPMTTSEAVIISTKTALSLSLGPQRHFGASRGPSGARMRSSTSCWSVPFSRRQLLGSPDGLVRGGGEKAVRATVHRVERLDLAHRLLQALEAAQSQVDKTSRLPGREVEAIRSRLWKRVSPK